MLFLMAAGDARLRHHEPRHLAHGSALHGRRVPGDRVHGTDGIVSCSASPSRCRPRSWSASSSRWSRSGPLYERDHLDQVLATFGLILFFNELIAIIWGRAAIFTSVPQFLSGHFRVLPGCRIPHIGR